MSLVLRLRQTINLYRIVKHVFTTKRKEEEERKNRANKETLRHKYIDALARKEDAEIENMSKEELQAMIESL